MELGSPASLYPPVSLYTRLRLSPILENISKRMADGLRDEIGEMGPIKDADGEAAMGKVVAEIRELEAAGEVLFVAQEEAE